MSAVNGLTVALLAVAVVALIGWTVDYRRRVRAERQRDIAHRIASEKGRRLMVALDERDDARNHADDAQWLLACITETDPERAARERHPSNGGNVRVLRVVDGGAS